MSVPRILIVDPPQATADELAGVAAELTGAGASVERVSDLSHAIARLKSDGATPPEFVLLPESRPGIWTERELQALRAAAPLVRVLRVSGSWCDGQSRSGRPPAGTMGIAWHQAASRLPRELEQVTRGSGLASPLTATTEDLLLSSTAPQARRRDGQRIAIHAPRTAQAEAWAVLCEGLGYRAQLNHAQLETCHEECNPDPLDPCSLDPCLIAPCQIDTGPVDVVLWDCDPRDLADEARVSEFVERAGTAPVLAVCGFPRPDDVQSAVRHGIAAVLGKPLLAADFAWHVSRLVGARGQR